MSLVKNYFDRLKSNPPLVLAFGFALLIILGGLILSLDIMNRSGQATPLIDSFFVAGSATCVTGLSPVNTFEHWNIKGQLVILILIQIGGLGIMTLATMLPLILKKKIGLSTRKILREQFNIDQYSGMIRLFKYMLAFTFIMEAGGALILSSRFIPEYGLSRGIWASIFHSISAFCNAGFDITGDSMVPFKDDLVVNITLMVLVIVGGLGFMVNWEIFQKRNFKDLSVHSKLVLVISLFLLVSGAVFLYILEFNNPETLMYEDMKTRVLQSCFQSVVARTCGYYSVELSKLRDSSLFLLIILMFIGGSPGSTAGGLKTTTFGVLFASTLATIRGDEEAHVFNKQISRKTLQKALALIVICLSIVFLVSFLITTIEDFDFIDIFYEVVSAFATVGASTGLTPEFSSLSKFILILTMYVGRLGPLTLAYAFGQRQRPSKIKYPQAHISIG